MTPLRFSSIHRGMVDALSAEIQAKREQRQTLSAQIAVLDIEIAALERAASLRPLQRRERPSRPGPARPEGESQRRGRQRGAISHEWRSILAELYRRGVRSSYPEIRAAAAEAGLSLELSSVRDRVRNFCGANLMEGDPESGFAVTDLAADRFGFEPRSNERADDGGAIVGSSSEGDNLFRDPAPEA